jgi:hypothetical protein
MDIHEFDDIRPYLPEELPAVFSRLLSDDGFCEAVQYVYKDIPLEQISEMMQSCKTNEEFQKRLVYPVLMELLKQASLGMSSNFGTLSPQKSYTFVTNHRDIVLDSAFLDCNLIDNGFVTAEIAIGDNLLIRPWIKDLVRVNKSFIVQRSLNMRQMLLASSKMSRYMHFTINEKHNNIWIAQREGRAKNSDDRTQESVLKMMSMGGDLRHLHIVPLAISYEYDPCDYLKAEEFQHKRDIPGFKKSQSDDLKNMRTGIFGYKGHIHYQSAPCIDDWLSTLPPDLPKSEYFRMVANHIDQEIHLNYRLYPCNYIALDLLSGNDDQRNNYSNSDKQAFMDYLSGQLSKISIEHPDMNYLRECILTMYANPAINHLKAISKEAELI